MIKHIIFDFDGVIVDSFNYHYEALNKIYDLNLTKDAYRSMLSENFFLGDNILKHLDWKPYNNFMLSRNDLLTVSDEVKNFLEKYKVEKTIVTSGSCPTVQKHINHNQLEHHFTHILCMEDSYSKVEKFNMIFKAFDVANDECLFITDTVGDIKEAHQVGLKTIAVDFGFQKREDLLTANPYRICSSWREVSEVVDAVMS